MANPVEGPDPRFGMQAPINNSQTITTPGGLVWTATTGRTANLADPANLLSLTTQTDTVKINGRTYTRAYDAATHTFTDTTPVGRQSVTTIDGKGRLVQAAVAGIAPVQLAYDGRGRLASLTQDDRTYTLTYDSQGYMSLLTDPLTRSVGFTYDAAGRPTLLTRPDGKQISFTYDANGNLASLTPPGRAPHTFSYTPIDLLQSYAPPVETVGGVAHTYDYGYDLADRLEQVKQDGLVTASYTYDGNGNRLTGPSVLNTAAYDDQDRLLSYAGSTYDYTANGELKTRTAAHESPHF